MSQKRKLNRFKVRKGENANQARRRKRTELEKGNGKKRGTTLEPRGGGGGRCILGQIWPDSSEYPGGDGGRDSTGLG